MNTRCSRASPAAPIRAARRARRGCRTSKHGLAPLERFGVTPTITRSFPGSAAGAPPLTGASISATPRSAAASASDARLGSTVLCTAMTPPGATPGAGRRPPARRRSSLTTHRHTRSEARRRSAGVAANDAPRSPKGSSVVVATGPQRRLEPGGDDPMGHGRALRPETDVSHAHGSSSSRRRPATRTGACSPTATRRCGRPRRW